jgi:hypothetical protein
MMLLLTRLEPLFRGLGVKIEELRNVEIKLRGIAGLSPQ